MADLLADHLASLPGPLFGRMSKAILAAAPTSRAIAERAISQRLSDAAWVAATLDRLGAGAHATFDALARAGVPVDQSDLSSLAGDSDVIEALVEHGLLAGVRNARGVPTHIGLTPGIARPAALAPASAELPPGIERAFAQRRSAIALLLAGLHHVQPRVTRNGRLHASDALALVAETGMPQALAERRTDTLVQLTICRVVDGRVAPTLLPRLDVARVFLATCLHDLARPAQRSMVLALVERLLRSNGEPVAEAIAAAQARVLGARAHAPEHPKLAARREALDDVRSLLDVDALFVTDTDLPRIWLDPELRALLLERPFAPPVYARGHVQSSFELIAPPGVDPSALLAVLVASTPVSLDHTLVARLDRDRARTSPVGRELTLDALRRLASTDLPANVERSVTDWMAPTPALPDVTLPLESLRAEAWRALDGAAEEAA